MATKYYRDSSNNYIGGFDGAIPPLGSIEVPFPPKDARFLWDGVQWVEPAPLKDVITEEKVVAQVVKEGVTTEDRVKALELLANGDKTEFDRIQAIFAKAVSDNTK